MRDFRSGSGDSWTRIVRLKNRSVGSGVALALAPHPDDPDAIAVTLRLLADRGWEMHWAVVTSGWSGVSDNFCGPDRRMKAEARQAEQRESARLFGLPEDRLRFLETEETGRGRVGAPDSTTIGGPPARYHPA